MADDVTDTPTDQHFTITPDTTGEKPEGKDEVSEGELEKVPAITSKEAKKVSKFESLLTTVTKSIEGVAKGQEALAKSVESLSTRIDTIEKTKKQDEEPKEPEKPKEPEDEEKKKKKSVDIEATVKEAVEKALTAAETVKKATGEIVLTPTPNAEDVKKIGTKVHPGKALMDKFRAGEFQPGPNAKLEVRQFLTSLEN